MQIRAKDGGCGKVRSGSHQLPGLSTQLIVELHEFIDSERKIGVTSKTPSAIKKDGKWIEVDGIRYLDFTPDIRPLEAMFSMTHLNIREIDERLQKERHLNR